MRVLGIVAEYNPFHNGHKYHIEKSKEVTNCDYVVCVMSGNFIQRGLPALLNKWARTEMALFNNADLVIELPVYYALSSAEQFASGSISILNSLGIVDSICFGSESGNIQDLIPVAEILSHEPEEFKNILAKHLQTGISYPSARALALSDYLKNNDETFNLKLTSEPNNILGIEYIKALVKLQSKINPYTIERIKSCYNSTSFKDGIASATAIRKLLSEQQLGEIKKLMPQTAFEILQREISHGRCPVFVEAFENAILTQLRNTDIDSLLNIPDVSEGIENRIKKTALNCGSVSELFEGIKTKRYTLTRIQRIIMANLLGINKKDSEEFNLNGGPQYIRILGFNSKGKELLSKIKSSSLPLVTSPQDFLKKCNPRQAKMLNSDILATNIFSLGYSDKSQRKAGQDFYQKIISI
ncbi:MAG: nucleotidyltransferase [Ignavibacteriales bacterium]